MLGSPSSGPKCFVMNIKRYLTNYKLSVLLHGKDFCRFTFSLAWDTVPPPFWLIFLTLRCLKFCSQQQKLKIVLEKEHQFLLSCRIRLLRLLWSLFVYLFHHNSSFDLTIHMFYLLGLLCRSAVSRFTYSSRQEIMFCPQCSEFPSPKGHL